MRYLISTLVSLFLFFANPIYAGSGHDHGHSHGPVSADVTSGKAMQKVEQLATAGKIDASWSGIQPASVEQKTFADGPEWVVIFKNEKVSDASKQTLYLFYTPDGNYIAANYTGE
ncbi:MAG: hypothetical protein HY272_03725 [Gammaproteobacteria bacterium]|nr:hypothetical protein [Gammaproteobacteria bacterium]